MSQHDMNIANQGFPAFRSDLNSALGALASTNAGATAPSTTFAQQLWYDSTANLLKMRNTDNDAWITLAYFDQTNDEWEIRSAVIQAVDSAGVTIKTDDGTARITVNDDGTVTFANNVTFQGNAIFGDDDKAIFGAGSDLQIWHNSTGGYSVIRDVGFGDLYIEGSSNIRFRDPDGRQSATFTPTGAQTFYHNNSAKLATTSSGVSVTGTCAATAFSGDGSGLTGVTGGAILQVKHYEEDGNGSFTGNNLAESWNDILTGATITPSSTSSTILVSICVNGGASAQTDDMSWRVVRDIGGGGYTPFGGSSDPSGYWLGTNVWCAGAAVTVESNVHTGNEYIDSPSTTSVCTYKIQMQGGEVSTYYYNRPVNTQGARTWPNTGSYTITLMEIAG